MKSLRSSCIGTRYGLKPFFACFVLATGAMWYYLINQHTCEHRGVKLPKQDSRAVLSIVTNDTVCKLNTVPATTKCDSGQGAADKLRLDRDIFGQHFASPSYVLSQLYGQSVPRFSVSPGDIPTTAHYVWCGKKLFRFEHYLAVLSIVKVLKPMKVVFHYNQLPTVDKLYHTWFQELRQSLPNLVLRQTTSGLKCDTSEVLNFGLEKLASSVGGGAYVGERSVLSYIPRYWKREQYLTYLTPGTNSSEELIVFTKHGLHELNVTLEQFKLKLLNKSYECLALDKFNQVMTSQELINSKAPDDILSPCLVAPKQLYPEDIINTTTPFGGLARSLYYGKSELLAAKPSVDPKDVIPAISHMISLNPTPGQPVELTFGHYLSILSALYLGGFERVYVHGDTEPSGEWWSRLLDENVTFVLVENIETVFQQRVKVLAHQSDILRTMVLLKYGGAYQDKDALWVNPVPEDIRRYSTVACLDWPIYEEWPRTFNLGIFMSKPGAPFLKHFLNSFWYQWDSSWIFNGIQMPYKVYERHPETLYIYNRLQIICYVGVCHPTWQDDYLRTMRDAKKSTGTFELEDAHALHFTFPKPDPSLTSFEAIKKGTNIAAQLGQKLVRAIQQSGRKHLLA